ncbi:putative transmembrane protein [Rhizoctonia solani 123E]|uniref:Putative transmembrane protein n=1 Tax=Rhizoctonia solani 123E TaxID=1423351 RepID=A0A074SU04_9AGAM|nr:putative transmembrane protein [Rhizoctonia solani 123E]
MSTGCRRIELSTGHAIGLAFSTQAGSISFVGVLVLFGIVFLKYWRGRKRNQGNHHQVLLRSNLDLYMINLFVSELLMSLGGMLDAKWANESAVYCGDFCDAQGTLQYLGETSVALWTLAVTLHTWQSVVYAQRIPFRWTLCVVVMVVIWGFVFAFNFGAFSVRPKGGDDSYFTPGPFWCWINPKYGDERLAGEYLWLWVAGFGNLLVYIPLFLLLRGNIVLGNQGFMSHRWYWTPPPVCNAFRTEIQNGSAPSIPDDANDEEHIRKDATKMLWYPAAYTMLVLPISIVRWSTFTVPDLRAAKLDSINDTVVFYAPMATATLIFHAVFRLSGIINVVLVLTTRPNVLLFGEHHRGEDDDNTRHHGASHGGIESIDDVSMRQRYNAASPGERVHEYTGFAGPRVINRRDDGSSSMSDVKR